MKILFFFILSLIIYKSTLSKCLNRQCDDNNDPDCVYEGDNNECCESCLETCTTSRCRTRICRNNCLTTCQKCRSSCPTKTRTNCDQDDCQERNCPPSPEPITPRPELLVPLQENEEPIIIELPEQQQQQQVVVPNITTNNIVNLTTYINLNNIVHNFNNITTPIFVNTTNIHNIAIFNNSTRGQYKAPIVHQSPPIIINVNTTKSNSDSTYVNQSDNQLPCCKIMGQKECYFNDNGQPKCRQHRYHICGPMCYSPVITQIDNTYHQYPTGCQNNPPHMPCSPTFINPPPPPPQLIYPPPTQFTTPTTPPPTNLPIACYFCWQSPNCPYPCQQLLQQSRTTWASTRNNMPIKF